ncbi:pilus assembly protein [Endozoicomonas sp. 8E]|uniref:pilus assembly protein n=1 Tax=Endozoicomonas sp. 8E TaxID=3035692 RepID=UPI002938D098|nr:PilC/PilY family type IV pilus protein [Endozoicomonas sp. 8E]WOG26412.1 PilC/PilY family type IV pilus protein [Endozoicomonas sp. 8E]
MFVSKGISLSAIFSARKQSSSLFWLKIGLLAFLLQTLILQQATADSSDYAAIPNQGTTSSPPLLLFALSFDHELFKKAYSDYTDIDGDGLIDITYKDTIDYYGYFESDWCYTYSSSRFQPSVRATGANGHSCTTSGAPWSGNFLNWGTMSRIDLIRKALYGGMRVTDTTSLTTLERAEIPYDFHAFSKIYSGADINDFTPYNSSDITLCNLNQSQSGAPLVRVKNSNDPNWAGLNRVRCQGSSTADFNVRVDVCHSSSTDSRCQTYGSSRKPVGLIQTYQELVEFGLITGSYEGNTQGGVIRKNISFASDEVNQSTGQFINNSGMVATINSFRISDYSYSAQQYNCGSGSPVNCKDWGNPMSEIYLEALRYFAGESGPSSDYSVSTDLGLPKPAWQDPFTVDNRCANCAIIMLSTGQNSYDSDDYSNLGDILSSGISQLNQLTDNIGNLEPDLVFPGSFIIGSNGSSGIRQCEPKNLNGLSDARGICPEVPHYEGSYYMAGLAHYARTNDLRPNLAGNQNVTTYAVELDQTVPTLSFGVPDGLGNRNIVSLTPICQTIDFADGFDEALYRPCRYLDQTIESFTTDSSGLLDSITFRIGWADETFGGDGDTDSEASYTITTSTNNLRVRLYDPDFNGSNSFRYGYSISGVQNYSGMVLDAEYNSSYINDTPAINQGYDDGDSESALLMRTCKDEPTSGPYCLTVSGTELTANDVTKNFRPNANVSDRLPKPLFLAAKYGGFNDLDNDNTPNHDANGDNIPDADNKEWDNRNNLTGSLGADGIPDNYFLISNPARLERQLGQILEEIASRISSGASAALIANSASGVGSAIQGLFRPRVTVNNIDISWVGLLHSLFVDSKGHFREDSNGNRTLDDYSTDRVVTLSFDPTSNSTVIQRYTSADNGVTLTPDGGNADLIELKPVWDARERLMEVSNITSQRNYNALTNTGRHILTWLDANNNGRVDAGEEQPFVSANFTGSNSGYLGVTPSESDKLVKYIRGEDQTGYRSRSVDIDNDGDLEVWRLGDIIHSNPIAVSKPEGYYSDSKPFNSNDSTFIEFQKQYENRRQVVYVGANDGMIHAFNAGFWNNSNQQFDLSYGSDTSQHPLGGELWAYAPMNLLPHLRWLSEQDYPHVFYMDGEPLIFDANIFTPDADHPKGWGTVLLMGMRLGGGPIDVTVNSATRTMRSAYVMLDITNPKKPPKLLAEITHPELGFTTGRPVVIQRRKPNASGDYNFPTENNWYLAFGSGPTGTGLSGIRQALDNATSDQNMKVFVYDLKSKSFLSTFNPMDSGITQAYAGNMATVDWDQDYYDDAVYFGSVETAGNLSGELLRINLEDPLTSNWTLGTLTRPQRPVTARPTAVTNSDNERWVFVGTGRELTRADSINSQQEFFFGVKEPKLNDAFSYGTVPFSNLIDTTDVQVKADGNLVSGFRVSGSTTVSNFESLRNTLTTEAGWKNRLIHNGTDPSGKSLSSPANAFALLLFTEYQPPADQCLIDGTSYLNALHYQTGTAIPASIQKVLTPDGFTDSTVSEKKISLGAGLAPAPVVHQGNDGKTSIIIQGGAGNISSTDLEYTLTDDGRQSWRQIFNIPR